MGPGPISPVQGSYYFKQAFFRRPVVDVVGRRRRPDGRSAETEEGSAAGGAVRDVGGDAEAAPRRRTRDVGGDAEVAS